MKLTFLGTGAATSYPLPFCLCSYCKQARENGGKDLRKRSSVLINEDLIIDMGPDYVTSCFSYHKDTTKIRYALQTHSHSDHFDASIFATRIPEYAVKNVPSLKLFASKATINKMSEMLRADGYILDLSNPLEQERLNTSVYPIKAMETLNAGNYLITAFPTDHDTAVESLLYAIKDNSKAVFYGTDTDTLLEEVWNEFHKNRLMFNVVVIDQTYGPNINGGGHLNANKVISLIQRLKEERLLASHARILATHISHEGNAPHEQLSEYARKFGYEIAYDGLEVTV